MGHFVFYLIFFIGAMAKLSGTVFAESPVSFEWSKLSIQAKGQIHHFNVEIAETGEQRSHGLMFRKSMPQHHGMLFLFEDRQMITMWMKNTFIPLDIIFLNKSGDIVHIAKSAVPHSLDHISSRIPVSAVLEVNAGVTDRLHIMVGDKISHSFFSGTASEK